MTVGNQATHEIHFVQELISPGFLFVVVMCVWLIRNPKTMIPLQAIVFLCLFPVIGTVCRTALHIEDLALPLRWDAVLCRIDNALGIAPAWIVGYRFGHGFSRILLQHVYDLWILMLVICWVVNRARADGRAKGLLKSYALNLMAGWSLFLLLPANGPGFAFPGYPTVVPHPDLALISVRGLANSIPSLHMSGALILVAHAARSRNWRGIFVLNAIGTAMATLALGEHYLIDLVVAVPFACFAVNMIDQRWRRGFCALASVLTWMFAIRWFAPVLVDHGAIIWVAAALTLIGCWWLKPERRLPEIKSPALVPSCQSL